MVESKLEKHFWWCFLALVVITGVWIYRDHVNATRENNFANFYTTIFENNAISPEELKQIQDYVDNNSGVLKQLAAVKLSKSKIDANELQAGFDILQNAIGGDAIVDDLIRLRLARLANELNKTDDALKILAEVKHDNFKGQVLDLIGDTYALAKNNDKAVENYNAALEVVAEEFKKQIEFKRNSLLSTEGVPSLNLGEVKAEQAEAAATEDVATDSAK